VGIHYTFLHNKVHPMVVTTKDHTSDLTHSNNKRTCLINTTYISRLIHQVASIIECKLKTITSWLSRHLYAIESDFIQKKKYFLIGYVGVSYYKLDAQYNFINLAPKTRQSIKTTNKHAIKEQNHIGRCNHTEILLKYTTDESDTGTKQQEKTIRAVNFTSATDNHRECTIDIPQEQMTRKRG
jgi:hypothetical protein